MPRAYQSDVRREQAARTRREVIDAAAVVFAERGWTSTTMPTIARHAGVAVETVYRAVPGGKPALLAAAVQAALAGGAARSEVRTDDRPGIRRVIEADSPEAALRQYAALLPSTWKRVSPLLTALENAGPDETLDRLRHGLEAQRLAGMRRFALQLQDAGALRTGLTVDLAADVLWTVCSLANYTALTSARGWPPQDYVAWVVRTLAAGLLEPADGPGRSTGPPDAAE